MKRNGQMQRAGVPSARNKGNVRLRKNQPFYGPVIELRTLCYGTHGRDRKGRRYSKTPNMPVPGINPLALLGKQMGMAMLSVFASTAGFLKSRRANKKRASPLTPEAT